MTEVFPGIHWLKMPIPMAESTLGHVNVYLVRGDDGWLLVDTGWNTPAAFAALEKGLEEAGASVKDITQILVTHTHPDHYGLAGRIMKLSGARLLMHETERGFIEPMYVRREDLLRQTEAMLAANGVPHDDMVSMQDAMPGLEGYVTPAYPDVILHGGETITAGDFTFRVIWTPGHSSGHICLYEPEQKVLLSGDHILPTITPNISVHPLSIANPLGKYIASLEELSRLDARLVLPGHDEPFTHLADRANEIIRHHQARNGEILAALGGESKTACDLALYVSWGSNASWLDLPFFHRRMAIFETIAHLEWMLAEGKVARETRDGVIYYRRA
jgi:glyoxylase-like metal-dependent hydrolase (beta-lactamase superfamily II)